MEITLDEIRDRGLTALKRELGVVGMIRFLTQFENGHGDYAKERRQWVDSTSLEDILAQTKLAKSRRKKKA